MFSTKCQFDTLAGQQLNWCRLLWRYIPAKIHVPYFTLWLCYSARFQFRLRANSTSLKQIQHVISSAYPLFHSFQTNSACFKFGLFQIRLVLNSACFKFGLFQIRLVLNSACFKFGLFQIPLVNRA